MKFKEDSKYRYKSDSDDGASSSRGGKSCFECGSPDHVVRYCPKAKCFNCGSRNHLSRECRKPRSRESSLERSPRRREVREISRYRESSPYPERGRKSSPTHYIREITSDRHSLSDS